MKLQTFILIGRSGSGKGTQAKLLEKYITENDNENHPVYYLETGTKFREFIQGESFSSKLSRKIYEDAKLQPSFLTIYFWAKAFIDNLTGNEHIIIDGTPRYLNEAKVLTGAMEFYLAGRKPVVLYLNTTRNSSKVRLQDRGRIDDINDKDIERRLDWFETDVSKTIEYLKSDNEFEFIEINGDQSVEDVHKEILEKTKLNG